MNLTHCPHCGTVFVATNTYCQSCGKALPRIGDGTPHLVGENETPATPAVKAMRAYEMRSRIGRPAGALLLIAIIQTVFCFTQSSVIGLSAHTQPRAGHVAVGTLLGIAAVFWGLFIWSAATAAAAAFQKLYAVRRTASH